MPKPHGRLARNFLEGAGFLEQVGGTEDDNQFCLAVHMCDGVAVELDHRAVESAHQQQGGGGPPCLARQARPDRGVRHAIRQRRFLRPAPK